MAGIVEVLLGILIVGVIAIQAFMILRGSWGSPVDVGGAYGDSSCDGSAGDGGGCN